MVKLYCPKCQDVYTPKSSRHHHTDGAYFGTGFPHMLFMVHPEYRPKRPANQFVARLYGFKIHPLAYNLQYQAASNFKMPMRMSHSSGKRWSRDPIRSKDVVLISLTKYPGLSFQPRLNVLYSVVGHVLFVCLQNSGLNNILR